MPSVRPLVLAAASALVLAGCGSSGPSGPSALQQYAEPAPVVEALSDLVVYSDADYGDYVKVRWSEVDGAICLEVRSTTSHSYTTFDYTCGFEGPTGDTPLIQVVSGWTADGDADQRLRWVDVDGRRCLETASPSSHSYTEVTFDCAAAA